MLTKTLGLPLAAFVLVLLSACESDVAERPVEQKAEHHADKIFVNARAYTLDAETPWAEAVAVRGDRIVYVGDNAGAKALAGNETVQHDLAGQMLLPGFIDSHMHPVYGGAFVKALALDTLGGPAEWVSAIDDYAKANPDAPIIYGFGFLATKFGPEGPTRQQIDAVVADRPVFIIDEGFHGGWANTKALQMLNITKDTPDPTPGYSYYKRDSNGDATGYLLEVTAISAMEELNVITEEVILEGTSYIFGVLNRYGVTSVFDAAVIDYEEFLEPVLGAMEAAGQMTVRVVGASHVIELEQLSGAIAKAVRWRANVKGKRYHYPMLKVILDGTVEGRTAAMFEDYQGEPGNSGATTLDQEQTTQLLTEAAEKSIDMHIHALGERAVHQALNAIEAAQKAVPDSSTRYTLAHVQLVADADLPRFAELGVIAQSTPLWSSYDGYGKQFVSEDQFSRFWRYSSLKELGVRQTWGSDFPATGAGELGMSPILQMEIGHTRQDPGDPDSPVQPRKSERLDMDTLIRGYTIDAAYQLHMEDEIGSIEVGKKADLVVLDRNLFEVDPYEIHKVEVQMTLLDGRVVYEIGQ